MLLPTYLLLSGNLCSIFSRGETSSSTQRAQINFSLSNAASRANMIPALRPRIGAGKDRLDLPEWHRLHEQYKQELERIRGMVARKPGAGLGLQVVFYGDSITEGWRGTRWGYDFGPLHPMLEGSSGVRDIWQTHFGHLEAAAFGMSADSVDNLQWRLQNGEAPSGLEAQLAILLIGTNDVNEEISQDPGKQDDLAGRIMGACSLLLQADPNLKVAILGILPKGDVRKGQPSYELPNRWTAGQQGINSRLRIYCSSQPRASFHDLSHAFVEDRNGQVLLRKDLFIDLLHPSVAGYDVLGNEIQKILTHYHIMRDGQQKQEITEE